ncbi:hypothetical protein ACQP1O_43255 (plasmid) [Nocardia sp. CA-151230]|uniref:hypothetical protein n=1 Tax=Nocardia sp. CA-151230 TaxID=3239982 RepID=UPI003D906B0A
MSDYLALRLIGKSGRVWTISGPGAGCEGVELMPKPKAFYDSPAVTYWISAGGGMQKYQGFSYKRRDPLFGLVIAGDDPEDELAIADQVRQDLGNPDDTFQLEAETRSGVRRLTMRLLEDPKAFETLDFEGRDPHNFEANSLMVSAACEQPHWAADPVTSDWSLPSGTSGSTSAFQHPGNPGDVAVFPRWTLNAPGQWTLPDPSFGQEIDFQRPPGADTNRMYPVVALQAGEDVEIDTNTNEPFMITAAGGLGPWMRSSGRDMIYPVAPNTEPFLTTVSVTGAVTGVTATIEVDRWYSRPFGMSL